MNNLKLRAFNEEGSNAFRRYLSELRENGCLPVPYAMLENDALTVTVKGSVNIDNVPIKTRMDAARFLHSILVGKVDPNEYENNNMWAWISLYFFDQLCPADSNGQRTPGMDYRYIPSMEFMGGRHRHLLKIPFSIYLSHGDKARVLLCNEIDSPGDMNEQIANRQNLLSSTGIMEALELLYYDNSTGRVKRGFINKSKKKLKAGTLDRFWKIIGQLELTYDLYAMPGSKISSLLPGEFDEWRFPSLLEQGDAVVPKSDD